MRRFEWRVFWEGNIHAFQGSSEWMPWEGNETTVTAVEEAIQNGGNLSVGLESAIDWSGFGWSSEVRAAQTGGESDG